MHTHERKAFTLVEVMIVVAIISIVAAIAVPTIFEARKSANEAAAIGTLKTIQSCQAVFRESDRDGDGSIDYGTLPELAQAGLIDGILATGTKAGYVFEVGPVRANANTQETMFWAYANPRVLDATGNRAYCTNHEGVVYYTQQAILAGASLTNLQNDGTIPPAMFPIR